MNRPPCEALDDYLAHDLGGAALEQFTAHLADCPACSRAVREQRHLDGLLTEATARLEPVPLELGSRVGRRLRAGRRRRLAVTGAAVLTAVAAAVVAWLVGRHALPPQRPETSRALVQPEPPAPAMPPVVRVSFPAADTLVVREEMSNPNVTFLWVYPGLRAERRPADDPPPERNDP